MTDKQKSSVFYNLALLGVVSAVVLQMVAYAAVSSIKNLLESRQK